MAKILVTGGAGYIGSHMSLMLTELGHEVVVYDNLVTGYKDAVLGAKLVVADLADIKALETCFATYKFDAVMHFASFVEVNESIKNPAKYYINNIGCGLNLLTIMKKFNTKRLVFSSSATVYGEPKSIPIFIDHPKNPLNPYGRTKLIFEEILQDYDRAYGLKSISLRYFNVAGANPKAMLGERHEPETHLIPIVLQVASGRRINIEVFGNDYPTKDGTCIRDYIHVVDLCKAHVLALDALFNGHETAAYNLGNDAGFSVLDVINTVRAITGKDINVIYAPRRDGDPAILVADSKSAIQALNWQPIYPDLAMMIEHAWQWECRLNENWFVG